jgi:hypothetical protein
MHVGCSWISTLDATLGDLPYGSAVYGGEYRVIETRVETKTTSDFCGDEVMRWPCRGLRNRDGGATLSSPCTVLGGIYHLEISNVVSKLSTTTPCVRKQDGDRTPKQKNDALGVDPAYMKVRSSAHSYVEQSVMEREVEKRGPSY